MNYKKSIISFNAEIQDAGLVAVNNIVSQDLTKSMVEHWCSNGLELKKRHGYVAVNPNKFSTLKKYSPKKMNFIDLPSINRAIELTQKKLEKRFHQNTKSVLFKMIKTRDKVQEYIKRNSFEIAILKYREDKGLKEGQLIDVSDFKSWATIMKIDLDKDAFIKFLAES